MTAMVGGRPILALALFLVVSACADSDPPRPQPAFYIDLARSGSTLDPLTSTTIINGYRTNLGLPPLAWDPALAEEARNEAARLAARGELSTEVLQAARPVRGLRRSVSGGYHSFADAFSGWRGSPAHDAVLRAPKGRRFGIGVVARPESRHRVYWVVLVAEE
jgi:uncharacterized protein YkwD